MFPHGNIKNDTEKCHEEKSGKYPLFREKTIREKTIQACLAKQLKLSVTYNSQNRFSLHAKTFIKKTIKKRPETPFQTAR